MSGPTVEADLEWQDELRLSARSGKTQLVIDSSGEAGLSPVQALAVALAGCMSIDVVHILTRGRLPLKGLRSHLLGHRSPSDPKRLEAVELRLTITGDIPGEKVERAIALSRERYCSVWHSLRQDIDFRTSFEVVS